MFMDQVTEAIAHFIGLFHTTIEQDRLRQDYNEFKAHEAARPEMPVPEAVNVALHAPYTLDNPEAGIRYIPFAPELVPARDDTVVTYDPIYVPIPLAGPGDIDAYLPPAIDSVSTETSNLEIEPPGSIVALIAQNNHLSDNDYVSVGGHGFVYTPIAMTSHALALDALLANAIQLSPFDLAGPPAGGPEIGSFIAEAVPFLKAAAEEIGAADDRTLVTGTQTTVASTFVTDSEAALNGRWVNGEEADDLPGLEDHLPVKSFLAEKDEPDEEPESQGVNGPSTSASGAHAHGAGIGVDDPSVTLEAGGNALVNNIAIKNASLDGGVFAVSGDHVELNAIIQTNAWSDSDSVGQGIAAQLSHPFETTTAFNIAQFNRYDATADEGDNVAGFGAPQGWAVTQITGDLIFLNWVQQFNFVSDQDVHVMASSGVATMVTTGENLAFNNISINDLGNYYDLILVGDSLYDANIISQMNVMLDDDIVGGVRGFSTSGTGSVSTGDNLLWNQAAITNVGGAARFAELGPDYRAALDSFAGGSSGLNGGVLNDEAFAGLAGLRVLYVTGSIYDLQYISQTNVLGDSDEVALAMHTARAGANADWSVSTGSNVLANTASIIDLDTTGKSYVGGDQYSYELLIQSEIIRTDMAGEMRDTDALVNEAVAFLGDDMIGAAHSTDAGHPGEMAETMAHASYHDVMQSIVS